MTKHDESRRQFLVRAAVGAGAAAGVAAGAGLVPEAIAQNHEQMGAGPATPGAQHPSGAEHGAFFNHADAATIAAFIGACVGFLWFNSFPAQVFMGDTGSLAIGGIIAVFAIAIRKELLIPILCGVFFIESLSVILQVVYFKYQKKKRGLEFAQTHRLFKKLPPVQGNPGKHYSKNTAVTRAANTNTQQQ